MPNPFTAVYNMALPNELSRDPNQAQQQKIIAFACILTFLAALYSIIKWYKLGYDDLADWAWLLVIGAPVLAVLNKQKLLPVMLMANISISFMTIYCCSLIYHLDGLNSAHIFWVVNVMVFAFLITNSVYGMVWFAVMTTFMVWLIYADQAGWDIPMFELDEKQAKINLYSGYILPTIVIGFSLWYSNKIRHAAIETAQNSEREALEHTRKSSTLSDRLGTILQKTSVNADTLLKSASDLSDTMSSMLNQSSSINQRIESQSESTHHMSETLNAMSDSVDRSAGIMKEIDGDVSDTHRDITQSASSMDQAIENMAHIRESHKAILSSMEIISDIADQTNLLALNAAIEAARAGDQGRGFAVVADEVRTLSIRSNESAQQIRQLLDAATQDIEQGSEMVNVAGERLDHAAQAFSSISSKISDAAGIANGQRSDIESIVSLSQSLDGSMKENEQAAHDLSSNADALASVADNLSQVAHETNEVVHESDRLLK